MKKTGALVEESDTNAGFVRFTVVCDPKNSVRAICCALQLIDRPEEKEAFSRDAEDHGNYYWARRTKAGISVTQSYRPNRTPRKP